MASEYAKQVSDKKCVNNDIAIGRLDLHNYKRLVFIHIMKPEK